MLLPIFTAFHLHRRTAHLHRRRILILMLPRHVRAPNPRTQASRTLIPRIIHLGHRLARRVIRHVRLLRRRRRIHGRRRRKLLALVLRVVGRLRLRLGLAFPSEHPDQRDHREQQHGRSPNGDSRDRTGAERLRGSGGRRGGRRRRGRRGRGCRRPCRGVRHGRGGRRGRYGCYGVRGQVGVRGAVGHGRGERARGVLAERQELWALGRAEGHGRRAPHVVQAVEARAERRAVLRREAVVLRGLGQLEDEVPQLVVVEVHELVHVGQAERAAGAGQWGEWKRAAKGPAECYEEVREEVAGGYALVGLVYG